MVFRSKVVLDWDMIDFQDIRLRTTEAYRHISWVSQAKGEGSTSLVGPVCPEPGRVRGIFFLYIASAFNSLNSAIHIQQVAFNRMSGVLDVILRSAL